MAEWQMGKMVNFERRWFCFLANLLKDSIKPQNEFPQLIIEVGAVTNFLFSLIYFEHETYIVLFTIHQ